MRGKGKSMKENRSYTFIDGTVKNYELIVEKAEKDLPLIYAARVRGGRYKLLLETEKLSGQQVEQFVRENRISDYESYNVYMEEGRDVILHPRSLALGVCSVPVKRLEKYIEKGVSRVELVEPATESHIRVNVLFHIEGETEKARTILSKILRKGEDADLNQIAEVLYPQEKTPFSGLWKGIFEQTEDCVEMVRAIRES
jgi:hypothetical protein